MLGIPYGGQIPNGGFEFWLQERYWTKRLHFSWLVTYSAKLEKNLMIILNG
jgi:hypothetical protein